MGNSAGVLTYVIKIDTSQGTDSIRKINSALEDMGAKGETHGRKLASGMGSAWNSTIMFNQALELGQKGLNLLFGPINSFITAASNAEESTSKFKYAFGDLATQAEAGANLIASSFKRSRIETMDMMASLQALLVPMGFSETAALGLSQKLVKLTYDLSSFYNVNQTDVMRDIQSLLAGQVEPARRYGAMISENTLKQELWNMGLKGTVQDATAAQKAQASLNILFAATQKAQGDAIRTSDSYANKVRELEAAYGELKISVGNAIISAIIPYMNQLASWFTENKDAILNFAKSAGDSIGAVLKGIIEVGKVLYDWKDIIILAGEAYLTYFAGEKILTGMGMMIDGFKSGIAAIKTFHNTMISYANISQQPFAATMGFSQKMAMAVNATTGSVSALSTQFTGLSGVIANIGPAVIVGFATYAITDFLLEVTGAKQEMFDFFAELNKAEVEEASKQADLKNGLSGHAWQRTAVNNLIRETGQLLGVTSLSVLENAKAVYINKEAFSKLSPEVQNTIIKMAGVQDGIEKGVIAHKKHVAAIENSKEYTKKYNEELGKLNGSILGVKDTTQELGIQTKALESVYNTNKNSISTNVEATENLGKEIDKVIQSYRAAGEKVPTELLKIKDKTTEWRKEQENLSYAVSISTLKMNPYTAQMLNIVGVMSTAGTSQIELLKSIESYNEVLGFSIEKNKALGTQTTALIQVWEKSKTSILANSVQLQNTQKIIDDLVKQYMEAGKTIPPELQNISTEITFQEEKLKKLYAGYLLVTGGISGTAQAYEILHPAMAKINTKAVETSEYFTSIVEVTNTAIDSLENMGVISGNLAGILKGLTGGISSVGSGLDQIKKAGPGLLGTLSQISGAFAIATGAISILSAILKLFAGKSGELKAVERALQDLSGVSAEWTKKLETLAKQIHGADSAARAFNQSLAEMIRTSDINIQNLDQWIAKLREIYSTYERGTASASETARNFGSAFAEMVKVAQNLGAEGGKQMTGLLLLYKEQGIAIKEVQDYINQNINIGFEGYKKMTDALDTGALQKKIDDLRSKLAFDPPTNAIEYQQLILDLQAANSQMERMNGYKKAFADASIGIFNDILAYQKKVASNPELTNAIQGWEQALISYSNTNRLTQDQFTKFSGVAVKEYQELAKAGFTSEEGLKAIGPQLARLAYLQSQYGYTIDASTQALIDQAKKSGIINEDQRTDAEKQIDLQDRIAQLLEKIAGILSDKLPAASNLATGQMTGNLAAIQTQADLLNNKFDKTKSSLNSELPSAASTAAGKINAALSSVQGQTDVWKGKLKGVKDLINDIGDDTGELDKTYTDHMTGRSIVTQTRYWDTSLASVSNRINHLSNSAIPKLDTIYKNALSSNGTNNIDKNLENLQQKIFQAQLELMEAKTASERNAILKRLALYDEELDSYKAQPGNEENQNTLKPYGYNQPSNESNNNDSESSSNSSGVHGSDGETWNVYFNDLHIDGGGDAHEFENNFLYMMRTSPTAKAEFKKIVKGVME